MTRAQRWIVVALETACVVTHRGPLAYLPGRNCKLTHLSLALDERWGTDMWKPVGRDDQG